MFPGHPSMNEPCMHGAHGWHNVVQLLASLHCSATYWPTLQVGHGTHLGVDVPRPSHGVSHLEPAGHGSHAMQFLSETLLPAPLHVVTMNCPGWQGSGMQAWQ